MQSGEREKKPGEVKKLSFIQRLTQFDKNKTKANTYTCSQRAATVTVNKPNTNLIANSAKITFGTQHFSCQGPLSTHTLPSVYAGLGTIRTIDGWLMSEIKHC